jgi:alkanesulfonate monooxygenase SsuD/methylene tetrahydromethanopterin reductase-like flavin-dependent oxidoreductase (luciferase family)
MSHIGVNLGFGNLHEDLSDERMYQGELRIAELADRLGFDSLWAVEHHFDDYAMCPDNVVLLANVAGRTEHLRLGTAAVILPWNDPLRVAEKIIMLDILSGGRVLFGMGRGLSRTEYAPFRIPMSESRARFDEAAAMIVEALESGWIEGDGPFYPQPRTQLRPSPRGSFRGRLYCVAGSPDSITSCVNLGAALMSIVTRPVSDLMPVYTSYREQYRSRHGVQAPPISLNVNMYCHEDREVARERAQRYITRFFYSNVKHYEMAGDHFAEIEGYQRYAELAKVLQEAGLEKAAAGYAASALWGTPAQIVEQIAGIRQVLGSFDLVVLPSFGGMPYDQAERSLELFAKEVVPAARALQDQPPASAKGA